MNDKKNLADEMRMTLPEKPGKATYNVKVRMELAQKVYSEIFLNA